MPPPKDWGSTFNWIWSVAWMLLSRRQLRPQNKGLQYTWYGQEKLTAVEAPSPKITALEPFCISVSAVLRQCLETSDNVHRLPRYKGTTDLKAEVMNKDGADSKIPNKNNAQHQFSSVFSNYLQTLILLVSWHSCWSITDDNGDFSGLKWKPMVF